jgi:hypothetical protein
MAISREEALSLLGFAPGTTPSKEELNQAYNHKLVANKGLSEEAKLKATEKLCEAFLLLKDPTSPKTKIPFFHKNWLLMLGFCVTPAVTLLAFAYSYWWLPVNLGLTPALTAITISVISAASCALLFGSVIATLAAFNKIATHKYNPILDGEQIISHKFMSVLSQGVNAKTWRNYFECFTKWDTYTHPLAFRAGVHYAMTNNQQKIEEIESFDNGIKLYPEPKP